MHDETKKILIVDDDNDHLLLVERYTTALGFLCETATNGVLAIEKLENDSFDLVVTDIVMPEADGMDVIAGVKEMCPETAVMVMTGYSKMYSYMDVIRAGAADFIKKPFQKDEYEAKLSRIFHERKLIEGLTEAKDAAEEANKVRSDFINTISHEFRTPMNGIIGFTEILLSNPDVTAEQKEFLEMIEDSADNLMKLINQLLDYSRLDIYKPDLILSSFNLKTCIKKVLAPYKAKAASKGIVTSFFLDESLPDELIGSDNLLNRILDILVENAIKFSDSGAVVVRAVPDENSLDERLTIKFSVTDNGCGISKEEKKDIFKPFTQVEDYMTRKHSGTGIGLAICARLVRFLEGEIWVESKKGKGSVFYFTGNFSVIK